MMEINATCTKEQNLLVLSEEIWPLQVLHSFAIVGGSPPL